MSKKSSVDEKIFNVITDVRAKTSKPLTIMDDITRMNFIDESRGISIDPHKVEAGMSLKIFGEMVDYDSKERLADLAKTSVIQLLDDDSFTWDVFVFEGDDAIYASIGLERVRELMMTAKDDYELER